MKAAGLVPVLLAACVSQPPDPVEIAAQEYRSENAGVEAIENYHQRKRRCSAHGGVMRVPRTTSGRLPPSASDLRLATCVYPGSMGW